MSKEKLVIIVGPTAVGKTALGIDLAKEFNGEVISGDSMQVYKHLDIGTAKVTQEEAGEVPHHLIDMKEMDEDYDVADFQKEAEQIISDIIQRGKLPILVGGSGLYIESLIYNVSHGGDSAENEGFRQEMEKLAEEKGRPHLWQLLSKKDPEAAEKIHENNQQRVIRALEVIHETGELFSSFQQERQKKEKKYDTYIIALDTERKKLYERIHKRIDIMLEMGLEEEARMLYEQTSSDAQSRKGIGYKEFFPYFEGEESREEAIEKLQTHSRQYAKRQLTWFRNRTPVDLWVDLIADPEARKEVVKEVQKHIQ